MHRRRDHLGRFLHNFNQEDSFNPDPKKEEREEEELFENMFVEAPDQVQSPTTFEESFHLNDLLAEPEYQDNPLALVIYQPPPPGNPQMEAPFPFPIPT